MAFGLVIVTTVVVALVAHAIVPGMPWAVAFVLGAVVSSTDEVAFAAIADKLAVPRHVIGTIEGESLINDATSLILYAVAIAAVVGASFSLLHAAGALAISLVEALAIGAAAAAIAVLAWRTLQDDTLQGIISIVTPFVAYLPAYYLGASGVIATVTAGVIISRYTPTVMLPRTREMLTGFWVMVVFVLNAFIFVQVGIDFHQILAQLREYSSLQLIGWAAAVAATCIIVRLLWTFAQGLIPATNEPEHIDGKADWSHVAILGWTGMRGGVSLAAALAIPLETAAGPFPFRDLLIFITFGVLLATLVVQGATLPLLIRWLRITDDGAGLREERLALSVTARAALERVGELERGGSYPLEILRLHRTRLEARAKEFRNEGTDPEAAKVTELYRRAHCELLDAQRRRLIELRDAGQIDNTVLRRVQRVLDLETIEAQLLGATGHEPVEE